MSGRALLSLGADPVGNMAWNGTDVVNGIPVDVYTGCLFVASGKITISIHYYFSRKYI